MIRFMKYRLLYFLISGLVIIPGVISLLTWGLKPGIDFTGGSLVEFSVKAKKGKSVKASDIEKIFDENKIEVGAVNKTSKGSYLVKTEPVKRSEKDKALAEIEKNYGEVSETRFETVGPVLGKELLAKAIWGVVLAAGFILIYVAFQFKDKKFGVCAILAMFHDTLMLLGIWSILGHFFGVEVDVLFVTAVLTILSFSVHDTVVVYDRIRESKKLNPSVNFEDLVDKGVNETLVRSLNNSMTIIFMLVALLLMGGETIKWFVLALLIGTISGTYSSTFTAAPLLVVWEKLRNRKPRGLNR